MGFATIPITVAFIVVFCNDTMECFASFSLSISCKLHLIAYCTHVIPDMSTFVQFLHTLHPITPYFIGHNMGYKPY